LPCDVVAVTQQVGTARYSEHYDNVRRLVPNDRLLEYRVGEILCAFLGHDIPEVNFPKTNNSRMLLDKREAWISIQAIVGIISIGIAIYAGDFIWGLVSMRCTMDWILILFILILSEFFHQLCMV
jgi:hypothetical protein